MIERYSSPEMRDIFSLNNKFSKYLDVEKALICFLHQEKKVNDTDYQNIMEKANFDLPGISKLEEETKHDVIAFTRNVSSYLGPEKKWIHYGLTSSDVVDTATGAIYKQANEVLEKDLMKLKSVIKDKAIKYKDTYCIGRTHGIHADIMTFGMKWALYYDELTRDEERFTLARKEIEVGKISGAVGTSVYLPIAAQDYICSYLGLGSVNISTQVLQRDRHAYYAATIALIGGLLEKIGTEIRNLQRTEIHEVEEYFAPSQKGSSAMPHKHNPISSENICGCARLLRGYMLSIYEDMALYHERDISHSSVERVALVDMVTLLDYMLRRMSKIIETLNVYPKRMLQNMGMTNNVIYSQRVLTFLIDKGLSREESYDLIQPIAIECYETGKDFFILLEENKKVSTYLSKDDIKSFKGLSFYSKNVSSIYKRVGID
jgi:adenylosuccinate lyase